MDELVMVLCREVDKYGGRPTIIYPLKVQFSNTLAFSLGLRSRYNPELMYFVTLKENYNNNKEEVEKCIMNLEKYEEFNLLIAGECDIHSYLQSNGIVML